MTYDYECDECKIIFSVIKRMSESSNPESCPKCMSSAQRIYASPPVTACPKSFEANYYPSLGKVFETRRDLKYHLDKNNMVEVGNDFSSGDRMQKSFEADRERRRKKAWEEMDI